MVWCFIAELGGSGSGYDASPDSSPDVTFVTVDPDVGSGLEPDTVPLDTNMRCSKRKRLCWCVDADGYNIFGSTRRISDPDFGMNCDDQTFVIVESSPDDPDPVISGRAVNL